jgi:hypothetical protein
VPDSDYWLFERADIEAISLLLYQQRLKRARQAILLKNRASLFPRWFVINIRQEKSKGSKEGRGETMKNKLLNIVLMAVFGVGGIGTLVITWGQPLSLSDRILPTFGGVIGLAWVLILAMLSRLTPVKPDTCQVQVIVHDETDRVDANWELARVTQGKARSPEARLS